MTLSIAKEQYSAAATGVALEACRHMQEAQEIWNRIEARQPAWDFNATWISFRTWVSHFSRGDVPVLKVTADGQAVGLFPARITRRSTAGVRFRIMSSLGNQHWGTGYPIVGSEPEEAIRALVLGLKRRRDWDVLEIGPMASDCLPARLLLSAAGEANLAPMICHQEDDWQTQISGTWEEYYMGRSASLRKDVVRGERRLAALGRVTFEISSGGPELSKHFAEFCEVEGSGWKGRGGTAIRCNPAVMRFHEDLIRSAAERGQLRLFFLRLNGRAVACQEVILHDNVAYAMKIGRDETLDECGLGNILQKRILEHLFRNRGAHTFDMMIGGGAHSTHKVRWGTAKREYVSLRFYNPKTLRGLLARSWFSMRSLAQTRRQES